MRRMSGGIIGHWRKQMSEISAVMLGQIIEKDRRSKDGKTN